jgi:hypothetical protein
MPSIEKQPEDRLINEIKELKKRVAALELLVQRLTNV